MIFGKRRRMSKSTSQVKQDNSGSKVNSTGIEAAPKQSEHIHPVKVSFAAHMARYTGQTVTIFTSSGGVSGMGFTGVLLKANDIYISLVTRIGPLPACSLGSSCLPLMEAGYYSWSNTYSFSCQSGSAVVNTLGSITHIKADRIAAFVHNAV